MSLLKSPPEIEILREGGRRLALVLRTLADTAKAGVTPKELDALAETLIRSGGDEPAFLNYQPDLAKIPFPATLCVSVNDAVVHGIPTDVPLKNGDIVDIETKDSATPKRKWLDYAKTTMAKRHIKSYLDKTSTMDILAQKFFGKK